jgi:prepilin-type N-terminal cleavage/methylation domain-containing protein
MKRRRSGVTLVELLVVVLLVSVLVRIALPAYHKIAIRAQAAAILSEINTVRLAAFSYHADHNRWPPDVNRGVTPPELKPYLGEDFSFRRERYVLDWDNWMLPDGTPKHSQTDVLIGISLATSDALLGATLIALTGPNTVQYTISEHYTFIIAAH